MKPKKPAAERTDTPAEARDERRETKGVQVNRNESRQTKGWGSNRNESRQTKGLEMNRNESRQTKAWSNHSIALERR